MNNEHLSALRVRLSNERNRMAAAKGKERELRAVWCSQIEKEINEECFRFRDVSAADLSSELEEMGF